MKRGGWCIRFTDFSYELARLGRTCQPVVWLIYPPSFGRTFSVKVADVKRDADQSLAVMKTKTFI
jgi:hypothetical protein